MQSLLKSDIFFFITSICVIVVSILIVYVLVYIVRILMDLKKLSRKIDQEGEKIVDDIGVMRETVKDRLIDTPVFRGIFGSTKKKTSKKRDKSV